MNTNQSHSGSGDNVGGNKILNIGIPKLLIIGVLALLAICAFIYWRSVKERFIFNRDNIDVAMSVIDSLRIKDAEGNKRSESVSEVYYNYTAKDDSISIFPFGEYLDKFSTNGILGEAIELYTEIPKLNLVLLNNYR